MEKIIAVETLCQLFPPLVDNELAKDLFISDKCHFELTKEHIHPGKLDGFLVYFCLSGNFEVEVNMNKYAVSPGTIILYVPGSTVNVRPESIESECVIVAASRSLMQHSRINLSKVHDEAMTILPNPCIKLKESEMAICRQYYELARSILLSNPHDLMDVILGLGASMFHFLCGLWIKRLVTVKAAPNNTIRTNSIFDRFIQLVIDNYTKERSVGFYAAQLNLTPKYLSHVIQKVSGKGAPQWIDEFVILEIKNYLKYSSMDIKQIAYAMNFGSTPVFHRYFKLHTGLTPMEYRNL